MCKATILECKYCDGSMSRYSKEYEVTICMTCGAEWEPVAVEVELHDEKFDCHECNTEYRRSESNATEDYTFCSSRCESRWHDAWCSHCNKNYDARSSTSNEEHSYCSMECEIVAEEMCS